jgi:hypothetical protein
MNPHEVGQFQCTDYTLEQKEFDRPQALLLFARCVYRGLHLFTTLTPIRCVCCRCVDVYNTDKREKYAMAHGDSAFSLNRSLGRKGRYLRG